MSQHRKAYVISALCHDYCGIPSIGIHALWMSVTYTKGPCIVYY